MGTGSSEMCAHDLRSSFAFVFATVVFLCVINCNKYQSGLVPIFIRFSTCVAFYSCYIS